MVVTAFPQGSGSAHCAPAGTAEDQVFLSIPMYSSFGRERRREIVRHSLMLGAMAPLLRCRILVQCLQEPGTTDARSG